MAVMFPPATKGLPRAATYGPLQADKYRIALVYHTTETPSWAAFSFGLSAPHYSYKPATREWRWHGAELDRRVGTMKSSRTTGTPANEKSIQCEIVAYSDKRVADGSPTRLWVGHLTDDNYQDLAEFAAWVAVNSTVNLTHVMTVPPGGWRFGADSPWRLPRQEWLTFDGVGAHGGVTGQRHWDTGILDLERITIQALKLLEERMAFLPLEYGDGYNDGTTLTHPVAGDFVTDRRFKRSDVRAVQGMLAEAGAVLTLDGRYGTETVDAMMAVIPDSARDSLGYTFHGNDWTPLLLATIPPGRKGDPGPQGPQGPQGVQGEPGEGISTGDELTVTVN